MQLGENDVCAKRYGSSDNTCANEKKILRDLNFICFFYFYIYGSMFCGQVPTPSLNFPTLDTCNKQKFKSAMFVIYSDPSLTYMVETVLL